jgi:general secretion pathway protein F
MVVSFGLMLGIFTFVIPKLAKIFESMHKKMPPMTVFLIGLSDIITTWWPLIIITAFLAFWLFRRWSNSPKGRPKWDSLKLRMPVLGNLIRMIAMTRFSNTMATLLASNVPILTAMNIAKNLVGSAPIAEAISNARENITEGQSIAEPLRRSGEFPPMMIHMIATGEKTGDVAGMFRNIAEIYEEQVNTRIDSMTSLLEPLMIIVMGGAVAVIVLAVFMPLMDMSNINTR